ncbi:uncharacterized protein N7479_009607 [Penicillium vulpinum]|uniref:Uncharacterized protein n=1 Tax=Penicillium vulpinum TaxID=29845 RepID=A0A1V6RYM0_9EURO|nr:uncharacterized protein N7479_009607 [Penicillium vulpinum]KAJ5951194.1 hypothetical protein N7479_009607 [Penicillium vulpinum]OQE06877.1 hypothetical protein PENVUL_c016G09135 [Penicillium vulpinum]
MIIRDKDEESECETEEDWSSDKSISNACSSSPSSSSSFSSSSSSSSSIDKNPTELREKQILEQQKQERRNEREERKKEKRKRSEERKERKAKRMKGENPQRKHDEENHGPKESAAQRQISTPEKQIRRAATSMSDLTSENESIDQAMDLREADGRSSQKRKANELDDEDERVRTLAAKRGNNMNKRCEPKMLRTETNR